MNPLVNYIIVYTHAFMYTCRFKCTHNIFFCRGDIVDKDQQPTLVEQLKLELSQKNMIFSKKSLHLSKIVGQGMYNLQTKVESHQFSHTLPIIVINCCVFGGTESTLMTEVCHRFLNSAHYNTHISNAQILYSMHTHMHIIFALIINYTKVCFTGESGVVYCGYLDSGGSRDMVAIKTCKGKY